MRFFRPAMVASVPSLDAVPPVPGLAAGVRSSRRRPPRSGVSRPRTRLRPRQYGANLADAEIGCARPQRARTPHKGADRQAAGTPREAQPVQYAVLAHGYQIQVAELTSGSW